MNGSLDVVRAALAEVDRGEAAVVATVVSTDRSTPRHAGARMLVRPDGSQLGTIGGGEMEARVVAAALDALAAGTPALVTFDLIDPGAGDPGVCGGTVTLSLEPYMPDPNIVVIGCGHVGRAVTELAHWLGYRVVALDDRPGLAGREQLPHADELLPGPFDETLRLAPITAASHVVLVTRNLAVDLEVLPLVLATPARSIGVLGSRRRWGMTRDGLLEAGVSEEDLGRVRSPIGLEIDAETPEQIALSILSEIVRFG